MLCRALYQKAGMKQLHSNECVFTRYVSNIIGQPSLTNENLLVLVNNKFVNMEIGPMQMHVYRLCCHPVAAMILVMYVDNDGIHHKCEELVQEFDKSVKQDGPINLQREEELDWVLSVRYTHDKITSAIRCSQEAYIDRLSSSTAWTMLMLASCR